VGLAKSKYTVQWPPAARSIVGAGTFPISAADDDGKAYCGGCKSSIGHFYTGRFVRGAFLMAIGLLRGPCAGLAAIESARGTACSPQPDAEPAGTLAAEAARACRNEDRVLERRGSAPQEPVCTKMVAGVAR
jgi:hypothetical protein